MLIVNALRGKKMSTIRKKIEKKRVDISNSSTEPRVRAIERERVKWWKI